MFVPFLYELRDRGVRVGAQEALSLAQALALELHRGILDGFYEVARALCVHREQDLDAFDRAFAHHFRDRRRPRADGARGPDRCSFPSSTSCAIAACGSAPRRRFRSPRRWPSSYIGESWTASTKLPAPSAFTASRISTPSTVRSRTTSEIGGGLARTAPEGLTDVRSLPLRAARSRRAGRRPGGAFARPGAGPRATSGNPGRLLRSCPRPLRSPRAGSRRLRPCVRAPLP